MAEQTLIVFCTFGSVEEARQVGRRMVEEKLAACANLLPGVESIYRWKDVIETSAETMVLFKTNVDRYYEFERRLLELHSYEVPEVVAVRVEAGSLPYLRWVDDCCR